MMSISALTGSAIGSFTAIPVIKVLGRKRSLMFSSVLLAVSELLQMIPVQWGYVVFMRIVAGIASNYTITVIPMLCSEFLEANIRGSVGALLNVAIATGMVLSNIVQYFIFGKSKYYWTMNIIPVTFALCTFGISFFLKEISPKIGVVEQKENIFQKKFYKCFIVAIGLGFIISGSGINPALQYSSIIFADSFKSSHSSCIGSLISSGINMLASIISLPLVRIFKRKPLLIFSFIVMIISFIIYFISQNERTNAKNTLVIVATALLTFAYSSSGGPLFYTLTAEIFPLVIKTKMMVIVMTINWTTIIITTFVFPLTTLVNNVIIYFCCVVMMFILLTIWLPESMGKTLHENSINMIAQKYASTQNMETETKNTVQIVEEPIQIAEEPSQTVVVTEQSSLQQIVD
ncbi:Sugar_(And other) transporter family protein [Hexamita inflata]|uniref:Sugar_(And other) transporter family protein n=1 Tax=Hexamita inflata TaxID=28002 RepID=A0ABP1HDH3_9EUKA